MQQIFMCTTAQSFQPIFGPQQILYLYRTRRAPDGPRPVDARWTSNWSVKLCDQRAPDGPRLLLNFTSGVSWVSQVMET